MTELTTLARPYAVAAFKHAKKTKSGRRWSDEIGFIATVMKDPLMQRAAANPKVRREDFTAAFLGLCEGQLGPDVQNFVRLLIENRRLDLIASIGVLFEEYRMADEGQIKVQVASAFDLSGPETTKLSKVLQAHLGRKPEMTVTIDPELIGGVFVRAGDRVIDASVRGQIERLAKTLRN